MNKFIIITILSMSFIYFIESYAWYIRATVSDRNTYGKLISYSNIVLYSSRVFAFLLQFSLSFLVENGINSKQLCLFIFTGLFLSSMIHFLIFHKHFLLKQINFIIHGVLSLLLRDEQRFEYNSHQDYIKIKIKIKNKKIFYMTLLSVVIFSIAFSAPFFGAILYPKFRLTIISTSQILNFLGTLPLLLFVDDFLYRTMDLRTIDKEISDYFLARIVGFFIVSFFFLAMCLLLIY